MRLLSIGIFLSLALSQAQQARRAPGFALPDANQQIHDLQDYRGKVVLLDFMKTDCSHCQTFSHVLEEAKTRYGSRVAVLSVLLPPDTTATAARFAQENHLSATFLFDCGQMAYSYIRPLTPAINFPHLYIIGRDGMIVGDYEYGSATKEVFDGKELFEKLDRLIGPPSQRL